MNNLPTIFEYQEHPVRVEMIDDEPWFVAKDVCDVLGLENSRQAIVRLDEDERNTVITNDGNRGNPRVSVISESGVYSLIFTSRKPEAKEFKRWVTHEVLPAIRKTGGYSASASSVSSFSLDGNSRLLAATQNMLKVVSDHDERIQQLEHQVEDGVKVKMPEEPELGILFPRFQPNYMTISQYIRMIGMKVDHSKRLSIGIRLSSYCRDAGVFYERGKGCNRYPVPVLEQCFAEW
jgi:prophage antirepressor-like protein